MCVGGGGGGGGGGGEEGVTEGANGKHIESTNSNNYMHILLLCVLSTYMYSVKYKHLRGV